MKILFFGDIVGKIGREAIKKILPEWKKKYRPDFVIANAENLAHGAGITEKTILEMQVAGIDFFTTGNHIWDNEQGIEYLKKINTPVIRPANWEINRIGDGYKIINVCGDKILILNLLGRVFIDEQNLLSPFKAADIIFTELKKENVKIIIVDFHAEATSEKQALFYYLDGRVSAVLGTHTHVGTVNPRLSQNGTVLVEDIGMVGAFDAILGDTKENILQRFLTDEKKSLTPAEKGPAIINSILLDIDNDSGQTKEVKRLDQIIDLF